MSHRSLTCFHKDQCEAPYSLLRVEFPVTCTEVSNTPSAAAVSENTRKFLAD